MCSPRPAGDNKMARYLARIIRAVVVSIFGVGGGIGMLAFIALVVLRSDQITAIEMAIQSAIVIGLAFGCFMALVFLLTDLTMRLTVAHGRYEEIWELEQTRTIELKGSLRDVRRLCREALLAVPNLKSVAEESDQPGLTASTGNSWRSAGEQVEVSFEPVEENRWIIKCESHCTQKNIAYDYAKNYENVESWLRRLAKLREDQEKAIG